MSENVRYEMYNKEVPAGYNLLDAPPGDLDLYGIPQRPDAQTETPLFGFWKKLVSPRFQRITPSLALAAGPSFQTQPPGTLESSLNWSGAVVAPPWPKRFVFAAASWIAPAVTRPSAPALFTHADDPKSLIWVGLDGFNGRLPKMSLPQIGTAHRPEDAPPDQRHFAWWCWWYPGLSQPVTQISGFKVRAGDEILAGLQVLISKDILFFIKNQSTGDFFSFCARQPPLPDIEPLGSSAEWVVERPTDPTSLELYPLAAYGAVDFKHCFAVAADGPLAPRRSITLADNGCIIKMREAFANPYRTVYVSRAKRRRDPDGSIGVTCTFHEPT
jgi:hypothetical protein